MHVLTVDFINVGYGDAILVRESISGFSMLVDCGDVTTGASTPSSRRISAADFLLQEQINKLDILVLTHLHRDHTGGLLPLLRQVQVKECWTGFLPPEDFWNSRLAVGTDYSQGARCLIESIEICLKALRQMKERHTVIRKTDAEKAGLSLAPGLMADVYQESDQLFRRQDAICEKVLAGEEDGKSLDILDGFVNNASIRLRLEYAGASIELPGDTYAACWAKHRLKTCSVVKLPHHGHPDSLSEHLLAMLDPKYVVISTSDARTDDCPSAKVIEMLRRRGLEPMFTDAVARYGVKAAHHQSVRITIGEDGNIQTACYTGPLLRGDGR